MTADDIKEIAEQVWQYKIGDVQARDRLYGIDSIRGPEQNDRQIQIADQVQEIAQNLKTTSQTDISQLTACESTRPGRYRIGKQITNMIY